MLRWLAEQNRAAVFTTAITQAEILYDIAMLSSGKKRSRLHSAVERLFADEFPERILPFTSQTALVYPKFIASEHASRAPNLSVRCTDCVGMPVAKCDASHPEYW